jgi:hypothetical protein
MPLKTIPQRKFLKGLISTTPKWEQNSGSVPRLSNLLLTDRGGLSTCDGSALISAFNGVAQTNFGPWTEIFLFQPNNVARYYIGLIKALVGLGSVSLLALVDNGAGGSLGAATYKYRVTALDGAGGECLAPTELSIAIAANHTIKLTWNALNNAISYNVYRTAPNGVTGTETLQLNTTLLQFIDDGSIAPGSQILPTVDTSQTVSFTKIPATSWSGADVITTFPADPFIPVDGTPGGDGGGGGGTGGTGGGSGGPPTPSGGNTGNTSPIPQIVQFANKAILALGNGFAPRLFTDPATIAAITNTFTAIYPPWITAVVFNAGAVILPTVGNAGNFIFTAQQGGTTGGAQPTWPQTPNQIVNDNNIIWKNTGAASTTPAPRGAAHAEVYAGSLWLANTSPTTTADNFDGPTCLKMSDLNNPTSWNPLNVAFLGKDDGDQITGLKAFTIAADGITPTGSLVVFKYFKTFQVIGVFGAADFAIQEAKTDMGCIASRSIQFLPGFGLARLTHLGVAIFDGTNDRLISEEIRPYLFFQPDLAPDIQALDQNFAYLSKGAQSADPPMYMLAIPLALAPLPEATVSVVGDFSSSWNVPIFLKVTRLSIVNGVSQEVAVSIEFTPHPLFGVSSPRVQGTPNVSAVAYRIYYGSRSFTYTNFVQVTPAQFQGGIVFSGVSSFTSTGSPAIGTGGLTRILCYDLVLKAWVIIDLPFAISVLKQVRAVGTNPITIAGGFSDSVVRRLQSNDLTWDNGTPVAWSMRSAEVFGKLSDSRIYYRRLTIQGTTTQSNLTMNALFNLDGADGSIIPVNMYILGNQLGTFDFLAQVDIGFTNYTTHVTLSGTGNVEITALSWEAATLREGVPPVI